MIDSVPLIQNANDAQQINASIIAMKKASRELDEKIVKLNSLNSELDKKIALLDSGLNKEIEDRKEAINSLDVPSVGGSGKYISAISETDGKISATASDITSSVSSGNSQPVTSGGVADAIQNVTSLPTDAVLHYSFDEVPDYPDGMATYKKDNDFSTTSDWQLPADITATLVNNCIKLQSDGTRVRIFAKNNIFTTNNLKGKIVIVKFTSTFSVVSVGFQPQVEPYPWYNLSKAKQNGNEYTYIGVLPSDIVYGSTYISFSSSSASADNAVIISAIYIGDGSYTTPIIDNANGQNNATNNGGIAVQGVSGKGVKTYSGKAVNVGNFNLNEDFSISIWVNPENNTNALTGNIIIKAGQFILRNGASWGNYLMMYIYKDTSPANALFLGALLSPNRWTHLVITKNGTTLKGYKDGTLVYNSTLATSVLARSTYDFLVNETSNTRPQSYDDLLIFDRALSENEVMALYLNRGNTPKYYSWADWKLHQMENVNRSINTTVIEEGNER